MSNITVGKSWPRAATPCDLIPKWEGEFCSFGDWVNFASKRLTVAQDSNGHPLKAICVDTLGRRCANGRDFQRAKDENTFPVRYFFECQIPNQSEDQLEDQSEEERFIRKTLSNHPNNNVSNEEILKAAAKIKKAFAFLEKNKIEKNKI